MRRIRVYTLPNCTQCKEVKEYFKTKGVDYEEVDMSIGGIKENMEMKKKFKQMGFKVYPVIVINTDDDELFLPEFNEDVLNKILEE